MKGGNTGREKMGSKNCAKNSCSVWLELCRFLPTVLEGLSRILGARSDGVLDRLALTEVAGHRVYTAAGSILHLAFLSAPRLSIPSLPPSPHPSAKACASLLSDKADSVSNCGGLPHACSCNCNALLLIVGSR